MDFILTIIAGAGVGLAIGITGVGGGSLMTPLLLLFGVPLHLAVGTDLMYAAITKSAGAALHARQDTISWSLVGLLMAGSLPGALCTLFALAWLFDSADDYTRLIQLTLGLMLIITALMLFRTGWGSQTTSDSIETNPQDCLQSRPHAGFLTFLCGVLLGIVVTLSSVGAAAIATAIVMALYPRLPALHVLGTNMVHAVPLTLVAGLGHLWLGNVDFTLLAGLLIGSLPAIYLGTRIATRLPNQVLQPALAAILLSVGIKFAFF